jgi:methyl-accepting chemotaxis protein
MKNDKYEKSQHNKSSLKFLVTLFYIVLSLAVFGVFILTSVLQVNTLIRYVCSQIAVPTTERAVALINVDSFEELSQSLNENDPYYWTTNRRLLEIKQSSNCAYLFAMAPAGGMSNTVYRYILDGSSPPGDEAFSPLGTKEDIGEWDASVFEAMRTKTIQMGTLDRQEGWGALISAYAPLINDSGEVVGFVGCDIEADEIIQWIRTQVMWQLGIVIFIILVGLAIYISLMIRINKSFEE